MFHEMENKKRGKMGKDVTMEIKLTFLEAALGCIKEVKYNIGSNNEKSRRGKSKAGNDMKLKVVDLKIPPGVDTVGLFYFTYYSTISFYSILFYLFYFIYSFLSHILFLTAIYGYFFLFILFFVPYFVSN